MKAKMMKRIEAPELFYHVRAKDLAASQDPRAKREMDMYAAARLIRDYPTIPADPDDAMKPLVAALAEDMAVALPSVRCSFKKLFLVWSRTRSTR